MRMRIGGWNDFNRGSVKMWTLLKMLTYIHASCGIQTYDPSVEAGKNCVPNNPQGHSDVNLQQIHPTLELQS